MLRIFTRTDGVTMATADNQFGPTAPRNQDRQFASHPPAGDRGVDNVSPASSFLSAVRRFASDPSMPQNLALQT